MKQCFATEDVAREVPQEERELRQMKERVEKLDALLLYFAQRLDGTHSNAELSHSELYDYSKLAQEQVSAVLIYRKVAKYWSDSNKRRAKELIDKAIASHRYLVEVLEEQCERLAQKIEKIDLLQKNLVYSNNQTTGQMFDLKG